IKVRFKIQGGPSSGRTVFWNAVFSPRRADGSVNEGALKAWFGNMSAFGLKTAFFSANPSMEQIADALTGKAVRVVLAIREWQGQEQNDVKSIKPPVGGAIEVAAPSGGMFSGGIGGAGAVGSPSSTGAVAPESIGNLPPVAAEDEEDGEAPFSRGTGDRWVGASLTSRPPTPQRSSIEIGADMARVGYMKIGRTIHLDPGKWGVVGGDDEPPLTLLTLARRNPDDEFVLVGLNSGWEQAVPMLPSNITNPWAINPDVRKRVSGINDTETL